ncbi:MAG: PGPGW domain-containing protein [Steroidobacteraceae bacterium]
MDGKSSGALHQAMRWGRRIGIAIVGGAVLAVGIAMIVLPGPAFVVIPVGLGILSLEFERPRAWLARFKAHARSVGARLSGKAGPRARKD